MLLEILLLSPCFLLGKTSHKDSRTTLNVNKSSLKEGETLLFFDIDDKTDHSRCEIKDEGKHRKKLRETFWGKEEGHGLCDLLIFYANGKDRVFCFVELKDNQNDFPHATKQVISTYEAFKNKLNLQFREKYTAKAFICSHTGNPPQEHQVSQKELSRVFGVNYLYAKEDKEFLDFLRGEQRQKFKPKGKRQNSR